MQRLVADLHGYTRLSSIDPHSAPVDVNALLDEVLEDLEDPFEAPSTQLDVGHLPLQRLDFQHQL